MQHVRNVALAAALCYLRATGGEKAAILVKLQAGHRPLVPNLRLESVRAVRPLRIPHLDAAVMTA